MLDGPRISGTESIRIDAGAMGLVAELDAAEITLGPLLSLRGCPETLAGS